MQIVLFTRGRRFLILPLLVLSLCLFFNVSCATGGDAGQTKIIRRTTSALVAPGAVKDLQVPCLLEEQLIGGGYSTNKPTGLEQQAITIEASFPDRGGWHVSFFNPDPNLEDHPIQVVAIASCLTTPTNPLSLNIELGMTVGPVANTSALETASAQCGNGDTLLSGGFQLDPNSGGSQQPLDVAVVASKPHLDSSGQADGWTLTLISNDTGHNVPVTSRIYTLCSTLKFTPLKPAPAVKSNPATIPTNGIIDDHTPSCGTNQVTAGGGFEFALTSEQLGQHLYPRSVDTNESTENSASWQANAEGPAGIPFQVWAACLAVN